MSGEMDGAVPAGIRGRNQAESGGWEGSGGEAAGRGGGLLERVF
jgi:hypothetical protein